MATSNTQIAKLVADMDAKLDEHIITTADQEARMAAIEKHMDKLTETVIMIAKVEEKIADLEERREEQHERLNRLSSKIDNIEKGMTSLVEKVAMNHKISWLIIGVCVAALAAQFGIPV